MMRGRRSVSPRRTAQRSRAHRTKVAGRSGRIAGRARRAPRGSLAPVASVVQRLGVLLAAGVAPASCWIYLAEQPRGPATPVLASIADAVRGGEPVSRAISAASETAAPDDRAAWRGLAAAWQVATDAGAPLSSTLADFAGSLRSLAQVQRELEVALAAPAATVRMVMALPVIAVLFGVALGFDTVGTLFTTLPGAACLIGGVALMLAARWWNRRLLSAAQPTHLTPGLVLDLMAIAVSGGASIPRARAAVDGARVAYGLGEGDAAATLDEVLELSRRAGVPAAALLRSEADEQRRQATSDGDRKAAALAVTLMLPLGVCVLPAFMLLGVAPLLIAVISSTVSSF